MLTHILRTSIKLHINFFFNSEIQQEFFFLLNLRLSPRNINVISNSKEKIYPFNFHVFESPYFFLILKMVL